VQASLFENKTILLTVYSATPATIRHLDIEKSGHEKSGSVDFSS
jgi:hypothetical protein